MTTQKMTTQSGIPTLRFTIVHPRRDAVQNLVKTHVVTGLGVNANLKLG